jgi:hypothetical protein
MTPEDIIVALIIAVFATFMIVLFAVSLYVKLGETKAKAPVVDFSNVTRLGDHAPG